MDTTVANGPKSIVWGKTKIIKLPSGREVEIREQNGNDDDILSNPTDVKTGANISKFLASIIVRALWKKSENQRLTQEEVSELLLRDRFCILFQSRIHSIDNIMKFSFDWGEDIKTGGKFDYEEDLTRYIWDYNEEFPYEFMTNEIGEQVKNPEFDSQKIKPYPEGSYEWQEIETTSGKKLRYKLFNGKSQEYLMKLPDEEITKNTELKARFLEYLYNNNWVKVDNFTMFSSKDMLEIRTFVNLMDESYNPITEITHPGTKQQMNYPIMYGQDFFYQEGI